MKLYRAVSEAEYLQLIETNRFEITAQSVEGKYFAGSSLDALQWGELLFGAGDYRIIEIELPNQLVAQFYYWNRLDNIGSAWYAEIEQLRGLRVSVREV